MPDEWTPAPPAVIDAVSGEGRTCRPTDSFEIVILGSHVASFNAPVTVSVDRAVPFDATNVMFYCIENGDTVPATVAVNIVSADLLHFSHWAVIYDVPADVIVDDGDQLPPIWHYVPQQQASSSHTTTIMVAIAAAVAAIAVILVML